MKKIYCISGLGADERLFQHLKIEGAELAYMNWVDYETTDDLVSYAHKMAKQIKEDRPILLGVSFGGMLAIEIGKLLNAQQIFVISSVRSADDFPTYYRLADRLKIISIIPSFLIKRPSLLLDYAFGASTTEDKILLHDYLRHANPAYIRWALHAILSWQNKQSIHTTQIHGSKDRVIPLPGSVDHVIKDGGHFMIYDKAEELSRLISTLL